LIERQIDAHEVRQISKNGKIAKIENNGTIIKEGILSNGKLLKVILIPSGNKLLLKTAYYES
jgi:ribosome maturation protein Sdo1